MRLHMGSKHWRTHITGIIKSNVTFTVTAKKIHSITWMVDGTAYSTGNPSTTVLNNEQVATIPTTPSLQCSGKTFVGWNTKQDGTGTSYKLNDKVLNLLSEEGADLELYAIWKANTYAIEFDVKKELVEEFF